MKKKKKIEYRFYQIPEGDVVLPLAGEKWLRKYGEEGDQLHFHNLMEMGFCRNGQGRMLFEHRECPYTTGTITIIPENIPHKTESNGDNLNYWEYLFFSPAQLVSELYPSDFTRQHEVLKILNACPETFQNTERPEISHLIELIIEEHRQKKPYCREMIHHYMSALIVAMMRTHKELPGASEDTGTNAGEIFPALEYINLHYAEPIRVQTLADTCSMSQTHFRKLFKQNVSMLPLDYVNLIRIQQACEALKYGNGTMEFVAVQCGFETFSTFNRNFKKFLGITPYQWKMNPERYEHSLKKYHITPLPGW